MSDYKKIHVYSKHLGVKAGNNCVVKGKINFGSVPFLIEIRSRIRIINNVTSARKKEILEKISGKTLK